MLNASADLRILAPRDLLVGPGDPTALENLIVDQLPDGAFCYVPSEGNWFVLDKFSMVAVSYPSVTATGRGASQPGRWLRYIGATGPAFLSVNDNPELRALPTPLDGKLVSVANPLKIWRYIATLGAGMADDDDTIIKPNGVALADPGRYSPAEGRAVVATFSDVRLAISGSALVLEVLGKNTFHDGFQGDFDRQPVGAYVDDDDNVLVAGAYAYIRRLMPGMIALTLPNDSTMLTPRLWGPLYAEEFGAKGDASPGGGDAIQLAINLAQASVYSVSFPGTSSAPVYSQAKVKVSRGYYRFTHGLVCTGKSVRFEADEGTIFDMRDCPAENLLTFSAAQDNQISGIKVIGGVSAVVFNQTVQSPSKCVVDDCEFYQTSGPAVVTTYSGLGGMALELIIRNSKFMINAQLFDLVNDETYFDKNYVFTQGGAGEPPVFMQQGISRVGRVAVKNTRFVCAYNDFVFNGVRWFDAYGPFSVDNCIFSGETGGGMPIIYGFCLNALPVTHPWGGTCFSIINSYCATGSNQPNTSAVFIVEGCPQRVFVDNVQGIGGAVIACADPVALETFVTTYVTSTLGARFLQYQYPENIATAQSTALMQPPIPKVLLPYANPHKTTTFPGNSMPCSVDVHGNCSFRYDFTNNTIGWEAICTISVNPDPSTHDSWRTYAVYLLSMRTTYFSGALVDMLTSPNGIGADVPTLLKAVGIPAIPIAAPEIVSVNFISTGAQTRPNVGDAPVTGGLEIVWKTNIDAQAADARISLQVIHSIT